MVDYSIECNIPKSSMCLLLPFNRATENLKKQNICCEESGENIHGSVLSVTWCAVFFNHKLFYKENIVRKFLSKKKFCEISCLNCSI